MSESMSSPWIRDYFMDVAETQGAQLYNAPVSNRKKKVQLTDFLTYRVDGYIWAWISDKDYRVSVRISKDAADGYKSKHGRNIIDCRFFLVFITNYRPVFSPRPLGPNTLGNTPVSHISLEINYVSSMGVGAHLFGNPRDLESDENMKVWVLGLRQDGGGGNVLKLHKEQKLLQNEEALSLPPPPLSRGVPVPQPQTTKVAEDIAKPKPEQPQDLKRAYAKRWRVIEVNRWKFAAKPAVEERPTQTKLSHSPIEPLLGTTDRLELRRREPSVCPTSPRRIPSPPSLRRQGTPTDWSLSNRGSPIPAGATTSALRNGIEQHCDGLEVLPTTPQPSDIEAHTTADAAITSDTNSLQPPTPAQRIKRSPLPCSSSPLRSSPEPSAGFPPHLSHSLSSPPPPSSSLPIPSTTFPTPLGIRKNFQRKVPHPGLPVPRSDSTKQGPIQILVPNSDASGTGSSQPYSQSQQLSQSQQQQPQLLLHSPTLPSTLGKEFKPPGSSTPNEDEPVSTSRRISKMFAECLLLHGDTDEQEATSVGNKDTIEMADAGTGKQGSKLTRPLALSAPRIEVLEVAKSDDEAEIDELQVTQSTTQTDVEFDKQAGTQDTGGEGTNTGHEGKQLSVDKVEVHWTLQDSLPDQLPCLAVVSAPQDLSLGERDTDRVSIHRSTQLSERPGSRSPMHSLFSDSPSQRPKSLIGQTKKAVSPAHVPRHDSEAWKEPSFIARNRKRGKANTVEEPDTPAAKVGSKRRRSAQPESPVPKRAKVASANAHQAATGRTNASATTLKTLAITGTTDTTPSFALRSSMRPRLAGFVVDFDRIDLGKGLPTPGLNLHPDVKRILLTTGRIRTRRELEEDGSVYINL